MARNAFVPVEIDRVDLKGGLDLITPTLNLAPGICRDALNFECSITGGYSRIAGYERFDGQTAPSTASYGVIGLSSLVGLSVGSLMVGQSSGATASVVGTTQIARSFNGVTFTGLVGAFLNGETVKVLGVSITTVTYADSILGGSITVAAYSTLAVGQVLVGATSGAVGTIASLPASLQIDNGAGYTHLTGGAFVAGEVIKVGAATIGTIDSINAVVQDPLTQATFTAAAADLYRAQIQKVPGSGPVQGVVYLNGVVLAFRNNAGGTACNLYYSSSSGWQQVAYGSELSFTTGTGTQPVPGNVITQLTSGATATIVAVVQQSGGTTWAGGAGRFILKNITGTFDNTHLLQVGGNTVATASSLAVPIAPLPGPNAGGAYVMTKFNFGAGGKANNVKVYGCDSVNRGFELSLSYDGTSYAYVPITTGMAPDVPTFVTCHKNVLFFSFNASIQTSGIGLPYQWTPITGAGELAMPESITNLLPLPGNQSTGALGVWSATNTYILYGSTFGAGGDAKLVSFNIGTGAIYNTAQNMSDTYVLEMRGVMNMQTTLNYGNFDPNALTMHIRPLIQQLRNLATDAILNREKAQYRVFFNNGYGLYCTFLNQEFIGVMPVLFPDPVLTVTEGSYNSGVESTFFGTPAGYVMQLDSGTGFDGAAISSHITLVFNSEGEHRVLKRYRRASLEIQGTTYVPLQFGYSLAYNSAYISQPAGVTYNSVFSNPTWDSFVWDNFTWDGTSLNPTEVGMVGTGENVAITLASSTNYSAPFTVNTATIHYSKRRMVRGGLGF